MNRSLNHLITLLQFLIIVAAVAKQAIAMTSPTATPSPAAANGNQVTKGKIVS